MQETDAVINARREMEICNACRYCEGFCAVFPAVELRREFSAGDLSYLANLCHNCRGCYYACQYAPPHEWGINVPRTLAEVRAESYAEYAWPRAARRRLQQQRHAGVRWSPRSALRLVLILTMLLNTPRRISSAAPHDGARRVLPGHSALGDAGRCHRGVRLLRWSRCAMGARNFWRDAGPTGENRHPAALAIALWDVLTLKNLGGGGNGCNDNSEAFSMRRRHLHHAMFYGFVLCFAATTVGFIYHTFLGWPAPYPCRQRPGAARHRRRRAAVDRHGRTVRDEVRR